MKNREKAQYVYTTLDKKFPDAHCELLHENPFQLLIATILSAQCTDVRVNMVTPVLFKHYPDALALSKAPVSHIEKIIHSTGFYKNKAKNIVACATDLVHLHQGEVPKDMEALTKLAGVGRKTANVVLGNAFNLNYGIVVDTHVKRISRLLGFTKKNDPENIEKDLIKLFDQEQWTKLSHLLIFHGRRTCFARSPNCGDCEFVKICHIKKLK